MAKKTKTRRKKKSSARKTKTPTRGYGHYKRHVPEDEETISERVWELLEDLDCLGDDLELIPEAGINEIAFMVIEALGEVRRIRDKVESLVDV